MFKNDIFPCGVDGKIHPSGFIQQGGDYAAVRPRDGFSHPHQEHLKDTYILMLLVKFIRTILNVVSIHVLVYWRPYDWSHTLQYVRYTK